MIFLAHQKHDKSTSVSEQHYNGAYLLMRWEGPDALALCQAHRGLPVGFLLLLYSVLFTVESLSLLYILVTS